MRALIAVCRYLGDALLATPLAQALTQKGMEVNWLVRPGAEAILAHQPFANEVRLLGRGWKSFWALRRWVHTHDKIFVITPNDRVMAAAAGAREVYAALLPRWQEWWKRMLVRAHLVPSMARHVVRENLLLGELAGVHGKPFVRFVVPEAARESLAQKIAAIPRPFAVIHPFARWPYKTWPDRHWIAVIRGLREEGLAVVITGAPSERARAEALAEAAGGAHVLAGALSWPELAALDQQAAIYIGLDTANTHLAAAMGARVVALFGPTDPRRWGPWPNGFAGETPWRLRTEQGMQRAGNIVLLQGTRGCVPCHLEGCERHRASRSRCLDEDILPDHVLQGARLVLEHLS